MARDHRIGSSRLGVTKNMRIGIYAVMRLLPALSHIEVNVSGVERAGCKSDNREERCVDNDITQTSLTDEADARKIDEGENRNGGVNHRLRKAALVDICI